jgi:hypothetical protein
MNRPCFSTYGIDKFPRNVYELRARYFNFKKQILTQMSLQGGCLSGAVIAALWYRNIFSTAYLPINSNLVFDNTAGLYNVSRAIDADALFDAAKYESYSPPYLAAGNVVAYVFFFAMYTATISYTFLYHRYEIVMGFRNLINSFRKNRDDQIGQYFDVHNKLMAEYAEGKQLVQFIYIPLLLVYFEGSAI